MTTEPAGLPEVMSVLGMTGPSWDAWRTVAKCMDGRPLDASEMPLFEACTGRSRPPAEPPDEVVAVVSRRGGKSRIAGAKTVQVAGFVDYRDRLAPGETAVVGLAASDREQARVLLGYAVNPFAEDATLRPLRRSPSLLSSLRALVTREHRWGIDLTTGVTIEVSTANFGRIRGRTFACVIADEVAFWQSEDGSNPGSEVLAAIRPGLVTLGGQLVVISSPFAKRGPLWDLYSRYWGVEDSRVLVWRAASRVMNPTIPARAVAEALERDEAAARAEWLGEFRDDVSAMITREQLARWVVPDRETLEPGRGIDYFDFQDVATGSGSDSFTHCTTHVKEAASGQRIVVVDRIDEVKPPFDPLEVAQQFAAVLTRYRVRDIVGDRFAMGWVSGIYDQLDLRYTPSEFTRSELYKEFLLLANSGLVELPDDARLIEQLCSLQRRPGAQGREMIDHPARVGAHDDRANVVAGACVLAHRAGVRAPMRVW